MRAPQEPRKAAVERSTRVMVAARLDLIQMAAGRPQVGAERCEPGRGVGWCGLSVWERQGALGCAQRAEKRDHGEVMVIGHGSMTMTGCEQLACLGPRGVN